MKEDKMRRADPSDQEQESELSISDIFNILLKQLKKKLMGSNKKKYPSITVIYHVDNPKKKVRLFGKQFTSLNSENCSLILDGEEISFKKEFLFKVKGDHRLKIKFKEPLKSMNGMFDDCKNIIDIDLSKFKTNLVEDMTCTFCNCSSLKKLDVSHFDMSNVKEVVLWRNWMFQTGILKMSKI